MIRDLFLILDAFFPRESTKDLAEVQVSLPGSLYPLGMSLQLACPEL